MDVVDKRNYQRYDSLHLLAYTVFNMDGSISGQGMGRTLNVSESGLLLETHQPVEVERRISLTIGFEDTLLDVSGTTVYSRTGHPGRHETGIRLQDLDADQARILKAFIAAFQRQQKIDGQEEGA